MNRKLFFDLDGTLLDSSERLYRLFCDLIPDCTFSKEQYWQLKRDKKNHRQILANYFPDYSFDEFNSAWMEKIEQPEYLALDKVYPFTLPFLQDISQRPVYLLTARQSKKNLEEELHRCRLWDFFKEILVTENKTTKLALLRAQNPTAQDMYISDMGKDILMAKEAGVQTVGVCWGFMSETHLKTYQPDFLCTTIESLRKIII